jgi:glycosyltransferase involved in cell wall biosynthesis
MGGHRISLLMPFRANPGDPGYAERVRNFEWVREYWAEQLPLAEFIHGHDESVPYSKTRAVNDAARKANGDIFVILDADAYFPAEVLLTAAREIRLARKRGRKLWYVPYRRFYRLDREISEVICWSDPGNPLVLPDPPPKRYAEELPTYSGNSDVRAHWYGALVQVMPREAFEDVGGMDERFAGWGSEDVAFMRCVDTLYHPHKTLARSVCHLYHPRMGVDVTNRKWAGQASANSNWPLSRKYLLAKGDPVLMRMLVNEWRS